MVFKCCNSGTGIIIIAIGIVIAAGIIKSQICQEDTFDSLAEVAKSFFHVNKLEQ